MSQSVAINADSSLPDPSAILDLKSSTRGFLAPRMTMAQRNAITAPAVGLLIYQTDNVPGLYCYDGSAWIAIKGGGGGVGSLDSFWSSRDSNIYNANHGNVGIGTDSPPEPLTIQTHSLQRGFAHRGEHGQVLTSFMGDGWAEFATVDNSDLWLGAGGFPHVTLNGHTGNVGINTIHEKNILQIQEVDTTRFSGFHLAFGDGPHSAGFDQRDLLTLRSSTDISLIPGFGTPYQGNVGINANGPLVNHLQIGSAAGFNGNDITFGFGPAVCGMAQTLDFMQLGSTTDINILPRYGTTTGHVGIGFSGVVRNKFQIGNIPISTFYGNDFAIGNGTQATAFNQYDNLFQVASNTDIALLPQTGAGKLGINIAAPRATLDVVGSYKISGASYSYLNSGGAQNGIGEGGFPGGYIQDVSIMATNRVYASEFDAYSDIRIKDLIGTSDARRDFQTINRIAIRDYTMKDKMKYGNQHFKKVIAQELEKLDPDLVSRHVDFIPNVYQITDQVTKTTVGYLLHFSKPHHLGDTAKKLEALVSDQGALQSFAILSIPSNSAVVIDAKEIKNDHIFVYGEEVSNFRTVDYEGLTTLNISATQELSRQVSRLQTQLAESREDMQIMAREIRRMRRPIANQRLTSTGGRSANRSVVSTMPAEGRVIAR